MAKTELIIIGSRQRLLKHMLNVTRLIKVIKRVDRTKSFGLIIDDRLSWSNHVHEICRKVSSAIGALKRIRHFISANTGLQIYTALLQSCLGLLK